MMAASRGSTVSVMAVRDPGRPGGPRGDAPPHSNNCGPCSSSDPCKYFGQASHATSSAVVTPAPRRPAQLDVQGAFAAMAHAGGGIAKHDGAQLRPIEPARHAATE